MIPFNIIQNHFLEIVLWIVFPPFKLTLQLRKGERKGTHKGGLGGDV